MKLTKFGQSCLRIEVGERTLLIDPGAFSEPAKALEGADAVLITHEHIDHLEPDALRAALGANPALKVWAPAAVAETLVDLGSQVESVEPDAEFEVLGVPVRTFGGQHALIHPLLPVVPNVGYLIDGTVYHPGDSFVVPPTEVKVLLVPIHAPWSKAAEVIDFAVSVRAPQAFGIHDALLNDAGIGLVEGHVTRIAALHGSTYRHLAVGESVEVE